LTMLLVILLMHVIVTLVRGSPWQPSVTMWHFLASKSGCPNGLVAGVDRLNIRITVNSSENDSWHVNRDFGLIRTSPDKSAVELVCLYTLNEANRCKVSKGVFAVHSCQCFNHLRFHGQLLFLAELSVQKKDQKDAYAFFWKFANATTSSPVEYANATNTYAGKRWKLPEWIFDTVNECKVAKRRIKRQVSEMSIAFRPRLVMMPYTSSEIRPQYKCIYGLTNGMGKLFVRVMIEASNDWRIYAEYGFVRHNIQYVNDLSKATLLCSVKFTSPTSTVKTEDRSGCCSCSMTNVEDGTMATLAINVMRSYQLYPMSFYWQKNIGGKTYKVFSPKYFIRETIFNSKDECTRFGDSQKVKLAAYEPKKTMEMAPYISPQTTCPYGLLAFMDILLIRAYLNVGSDKSWLLGKYVGFQRHMPDNTLETECTLRFTSSNSYSIIAFGPMVRTCEAFVFPNENRVAFYLRTTLETEYWHASYSLYYFLLGRTELASTDRVYSEKLFVLDDVFDEESKCANPDIKRDRCLEPETELPYVNFQSGVPAGTIKSCLFGLVSGVDSFQLVTTFQLKRFDWLLYKEIRVTRATNTSRPVTVCTVTVSADNPDNCKTAKLIVSDCVCGVEFQNSVKILRVSIVKVVDITDRFYMYTVSYYNMEFDMDVLTPIQKKVGTWNLPDNIFDSKAQCLAFGEKSKSTWSGSTTVSPFIIQHIDPLLLLCLHTFVTMVVASGVL
ncbi:hypothetical protein BgiMline_030594, partial [Biomphalaria glabrata]